MIGFDIGLYGIMFLLVTYQAKHFLADYILQGEWMLKKFQDGWSFFLPLLAHSAVHGAMTFVIARVFLWAPGNWGTCLALALFDTGVHFCMDRLKAGGKYLGRFKPLSGAEYTQFKFNIATGVPERVDYTRKRLRHNKYFWWALGFDQAVHYLTHYAIIYEIVTRW